MFAYSFPLSSSWSEVKGWCAGFQRFSLLSHSNIGKSDTYRKRKFFAGSQVFSKALCREAYFAAKSKRKKPHFSQKCCTLCSGASERAEARSQRSSASTAANFTIFSDSSGESFAKRLGSVINCTNVGPWTCW